MRLSSNIQTCSAEPDDDEAHGRASGGGNPGWLSAGLSEWGKFMLVREYWVSASHCNVIVSRDENTMLVKKSTYKERLLDVGDYQGSKEYIRFLA